MISRHSSRTKPHLLPDAVLFDRDGTLVVDVPYNGDPARVRLMPLARRAVQELRARRIPIGVVSNQSGIGRGWLTHDQVEAVNRRADQFLGGLDVWVYCPHEAHDACPCRKPAPGLVFTAAHRLGVEPSRCAVIGDIGSDVAAALAAGARPLLVPSPSTLPEEIMVAPEVAPDLLRAVQILVGLA